MNSKVKKMIAYIAMGMVMTGQIAVPVVASPVGVKESMEMTTIQEMEVLGTSYYVDATNGDDSNEGTSPEQAWRSLEKVNEKVFEPGDQVLFKSGEIWQGGLQPKGSGTREACITINSYTYENGEVKVGEGKKPTINGAGQVLSTVWLNNVEYWEVKNLEVTNKGETALKGRTGVLVSADKDFDNEENLYVEHIYLQGLDIHDVNGDLTTKDVNNGGIYYSILETDKNNPLIFKDVLIEDCYVKDVSRTGISVGASRWASSTVTANGDDLSKYTEEELVEILHQDVTIRNNYVERAGGDAIVPQYAYKPVVEYNVSQEASVNTNGNPGLMYNAAIWPWQCYNGLFQYNEAFDTYLNGDGQAYDCDWSWGTTYQYNYSHDNEGGFMLVCLANTVDSTIRYNISQNDKRTLFMTSNTRPANIYNNTLYIGEGLNTDIFSGHYGPLNFYNNIFYTEGTKKNPNWHENVATYESNLFYGFNTTPKDPNKIIADPMFKDPGKGGQGTIEDGPALNTLQGYALQEGSPAINGGFYVGEDRLPASITPITKDFYGNEVGTFTVDLGAIDTMTKDVRPGSKSYVVDHQEKMINSVPIETTVEEFLDKVKIDQEVIVRLTKDEIEVTEGYVEKGMILTTTYGEQSVAYSIGELFDNRDKTAPILTGVENIFLKVGQEYDLLEGVCATDNVDGDVTAKITMQTDLNIQEVGTYTATYTVSDEVGNIATATREVTVVEEDRLYNLYEEFSTTQGPTWFYEYRQGNTVGQMIDAGGYWKHPNNWALVSKEGGKINIGAAASSFGQATFVAPKEGTIAIYDKVTLLRPNQSGAVEVRIDKNGEKVWPQDADWVSISGSKEEVLQGVEIEVQEGDRISFVSKYAGNNNPAVLCKPTIVYGKTESLEPAAILTGKDTVEGEEQFEISLAVENADHTYAQDITVEYDKDLFAFETAIGKGLSQVITVDDAQEGMLRILAMTEKGTVGTQEILAMNFKAKDTEMTKTGEIKLTQGTFGRTEDGVAVDIAEVGSSSKVVTVQGKPVVVTKPGDVNEDEVVDVADLALVAYYYQRDLTPEEWEKAKRADVNGDNKIDIEDLTFVAEKILEK